MVSATVHEMKCSWTRERSLALPSEGESREVWRLKEGDRTLASFPVDVSLGKPLDVMKLRGEKGEELRDYAARFSAIVERLYADGVPRRQLAACPCCRTGLDRAEPVIEVYGVPYLGCRNCGHVFIASQPTSETLLAAFEEEEDLSTFYVDPDTLELRMRDIIQPKLDWMLKVHRRHCGRAAKSVLDVGAGGGHFVAGCRRIGLEAEGWELSSTSVRFAREVLEVELNQGNYLDQKIEPGRFDLITFWGLLEYASEPAEFIDAACRQLEPDSGMLIIEVPRSDSLCLAVQQEFTDTVWRHAMPDSHMNLYSDASLATVLHENGFRPVAAWYFGLDVYELLMQIGLEINDDDFMARFARLVPSLQKLVDRALLPDGIVVAAVPDI